MLNNFDAQQFLAEHWQKAPCLLKNAISQPINYICAEELAGLALEEQVESRIIQNYQDEWTLTHGPFEENEFQQLPDSDWTLLVQTADFWIPELSELLEYFKFIPRWRFDDLMISYATQGGGVGPHFDNYDVFIIQTEGERHWRVGRKGDTKATQSVINGLIHLENFEPIIDVILRPGDVLYIPPDTAHWGVALNDSISYSVGFRAPQTRDIFSLLAEHLDNSKQPEFFADEYRNTPNNTSFIEPELIQWAQSEIRKIADNQELITDLLSQFLSRPKIEDYPEEKLKAVPKISELKQICLKPELKFNWYKTEQLVVISINGESYQFDNCHEESVKSLANGDYIQVKQSQSGNFQFAFYQTLARMLERDCFLYN